MTAEVAHADAAAGLDRRALDGWAAVCEFVREGLVCAGIDPARAGALRFAPPSANDDRGTAEEFVIKDADGLAGMFAEKIGQLARRYQDGQEPNFSNASLAELFAWCLSRAGEKV
jgi:hypothetical protein